MLRLELREKVQEMYGNNIRVSEFEVRGEHTLTCFYVKKGETYNIHGSVREITSISDFERGVHRTQFYLDIEEIWRQSQFTHS